jgi:hypothetical protein
MADRFPEPTEAKQFLSKKVNVETDAWDELKWGEHAHAFTVAHSMQAGVLDAVHGLLNKALAEGQSFQDFRNGMLDAMDKLGWYGRADKTADDTAYINWRIKLIYNTNMRTAYAAGQYRDNLENAEARPIWVYKSKLVGKNRRQEHIALHDKAFRYDDPFWNTYYPPNGWECKCRVTTKSEYGAKRDRITVSASDKKGNPPALSGVDWKSFDPTWQYNPAREALAPNFNKYQNVPKTVLGKMQGNYNRDMNNTRLTDGEFKTIIRRTNESDYKPLNILYQVGNLEERRFKALQEQGIADSKIMATDHDLWHGTGDKAAEQKIPETLFDELYTLLQKPEAVYWETIKGKQYQVFHFVKDTKDGKKIKVVVYQLRLKDGTTALKVTTMGYATYEYKDTKYKKIW